MAGGGADAGSSAGGAGAPHAAPDADFTPPLGFPPAAPSPQSVGTSPTPGGATTTPTAATSLAQPSALASTPGATTSPGGTTPAGPGGTAPVSVPLKAHPDFGALPLAFEPNQGQTDPAVQFVAHARGYQAFLTHGEEATMGKFAAMLSGTRVEMPALGQSFDLEV